MSGPTRFVRLTGSPAPRQAGIGTMMFGAPPPVATSAPRGIFLGSLHRVIRSACLEETRPGLFVFASTADGRIIGRLWLAATPEPRAGTVGRHEAVDLPVTPEAALSLRHFLFVVRRVQGAVRYSAIDLETPAGLYLHAAGPTTPAADRAGDAAARGRPVLLVRADGQREGPRPRSRTRLGRVRRRSARGRALNLPADPPPRAGAGGVADDAAGRQHAAADRRSDDA